MQHAVLSTSVAKIRRIRAWIKESIMKERLNVMKIFHFGKHPPPGPNVPQRRHGTPSENATCKLRNTKTHPTVHGEEANLTPFGVHLVKGAVTSTELHPPPKFCVQRYHLSPGVPTGVTRFDAASGGRNNPLHPPVHSPGRPVNLSALEG